MSKGGFHADDEISLATAGFGERDSLRRITWCALTLPRLAYRRTSENALNTTTFLEKKATIALCKK